MARGPYFLKSGKFEGKAIESLMFSAEGYEFLCGLARMIETDSNKNFLKRVRGLLQLGENPVIKSKCQCGRVAVSIGVKSERSDIGFGEFSCAICQNLYEHAPLKFSSLRRFNFAVDQKQFLRYLKMACGLLSSERMTVQKAHDFFYPPRKATRARQLELKFF